MAGNGQSFQEGQRLFINFAYVIGSQPFYSDSVFVIHHISTKLEWIRYAITVFFVLCGDAVIVASCVFDIQGLATFILYSFNYSCTLQFSFMNVFCLLNVFSMNPRYHT